MKEQLFVLGITGGIGSGKSEVLDFFRRLPGTRICQADMIGKDLQRKGAVAYDPIVEAFGTEILMENGEIDRGKLADIVFQDSVKLAVLNDIVHPLVLREVLEMIYQASQEGKRMFVLESAILLDVSYQDFCHEVWFVHTPVEVRMRRVMQQRGMSRERLLAVMSRQMSDLQYARRCNYTIDNSKDLQTLYANIRERLEELDLEDIFR